MRIALDGREFHHPHGIGRVLRHLLNYLAHDGTTGSDEIFLLTTHAAPAPPAPCQAVRLSRLGWCRVAGWLQHNRIDTFFSPYYKLPRGFTGRRVCTVHDIGFLTYPLREYSRGRLYRMVAAQRLRYAVRTADRIIAVSRFSRDELCRYLGDDPGTTTVIPSGFDNRQFTAGQPDPAVLKKHHIDRPYLLYVGNFTPHKRVTLLLEAWAAQQSPQLVLVGRLDQRARRLQAQYPQPGIIWPGTVPDTDLVDLYRGAAVFVYPSAYEGFGIPPVEALACGTPVVATRSAALPETLGDAAVWATAEPEGLCRAWQALLQNTSRAAALLQSAQPLLERYRGDIVGQQLWEAIRNA